MDACLGVAAWLTNDATKGAVVELYNSFISTFWEKLNRKRLASFMVKAASCIVAGPEARLSFLQDGSSKLLTERTPAALAEALDRTIARMHDGVFDPDELRSAALPYTWEVVGPQLARLVRGVLVQEPLIA